MATRGRFGVFIFGLAGFTIVAAVVIWYIWTQLTDLLEGVVRPAADALAVVLIVVLLAMMRWMGRWLQQHEPPV